MRRRKRGAEQFLQEHDDGFCRPAAVAYSGVPMTLTITGWNRALPGVFVQFGRPSGHAGRRRADDRAPRRAMSPPTPTSRSPYRTSGRCSPSPRRSTVTVTVRAATLVNSLTITPEPGRLRHRRFAPGRPALATRDGARAARRRPGGHAGALRRHRLGVCHRHQQSRAAARRRTLTVSQRLRGHGERHHPGQCQRADPVRAAEVTDLTSGQQLIGNFTIVQVTNGAAILTVVPADGDDQGRLQGCVLDRVRHRLLHLRRHRALSRHVDVPEQHHLGQFGREHQRRLLQGDHQRRVRRIR